MPRQKYSTEFKCKVILEVLQGDKELNEIAADHDLNPNMVRKWKADFLNNMGRAVDVKGDDKEIRRKEAALKKREAQMLKTIGQLTLERDFLQDCFRESGKPIPKLPETDL